MRVAASWRVRIAALGVVLAACHPRASTRTVGECKYAPPDSLPIPPIVARSDIDSPGTIAIDARDLAGTIVRLTAILDHKQGSMGGGASNATFMSVQPGEHALSLRSFGYGQRDTVVTMPREGGLRVTVPFSRGGGATICSEYIIPKDLTSARRAHGVH